MVQPSTIHPVRTAEAMLKVGAAVLPRGRTHHVRDLRILRPPQLMRRLAAAQSKQRSTAAAQGVLQVHDNFFAGAQDDESFDSEVFLDPTGKTFIGPLP